jgi:hypothetical protein
LYSYPNIIRQIKSRRIKWARHVARMEEKSVQGFGEKDRKKRPFERPRSRWENGTYMDLREIGWEGVEWLHLVQHRDRWRTLVNTVVNLRFLATRS